MGNRSSAACGENANNRARMKIRACSRRLLQNNGCSDMRWGYLKSGGMSLRANGAVRMQARGDFEGVALEADGDVGREFGNCEKSAAIARGRDGGNEVWFVVKISGEGDFG